MVPKEGQEAANTLSKNRKLKKKGEYHLTRAPLAPLTRREGENPVTWDSVRKRRKDLSVKRGPLFLPSLEFAMEGKSEVRG